MEREKLDKILTEHKKWCDGNNGKRADLQGAYLQRADLRGADLRGAYLQGAYLQGAELLGADLQGADLRGAYLQGADLQGADLQGADLQGADLQGAEIKFFQFPSIRLLSSMDLGELSPELSTELQRRDAYAHPFPERFDIWAAGGRCPYEEEERFWFFEVRREDWKPGPPEMADRDLIRAICKEKKWQIEEAAL